MLSFIISKTFHYFIFFLFYMFMLPIIRLFNIRLTTYSNSWIIGGHRGRIYEDNSAALHQYMINKTNQHIIWVTKNKALYRNFAAKNIPVAWKNSLRARILLLSAPCVIFSHGEDDLDDHLLYLTDIKGIKIFLNHSLNHLKTSEMASNEFKTLPPRNKENFISKMTDFDYLLCSSEKEKQNFELAFPFKKKALILGGGAHIDYFLEKRKTAIVDNAILYFPTFRDSKISSGHTINRIVNQLCTNPRLTQWLRDHDTRFQICTHINTGKVVFPGPGKGPFKVIPLSQLKESLLACSLFITDYSGLLFDYLLLDKPIVFFPFDLKDYLKIRSFYVPYHNMAYGPVCADIPDLVKTICERAWQVTENFEAKRTAWKQMVFPTLKPVYAQTTFETIQGVIPHPARVEVD